VVPAMQRADYGRIVNLSSTGGKDGNPFVSPYGASKAGVMAFTKSLAKELATTGIRVNCVTPALIATELIDTMGPERTQAAPHSEAGVTPQAVNHHRVVPGRILRHPGGQPWIVQIISGRRPYRMNLAAPVALPGFPRLG